MCSESRSAPATTATLSDVTACKKGSNSETIPFGSSNVSNREARTLLGGTVTMRWPSSGKRDAYASSSWAQAIRSVRIMDKAAVSLFPSNKYSFNTAGKDSGSRGGLVGLGEFVRTGVAGDSCSAISGGKGVVPASADCAGLRVGVGIRVGRGVTTATASASVSSQKSITATSLFAILA